MCSYDLQRFHLAQADAQQGYLRALSEIRGTGKQTHWIWYVFPQLAGLGQSALAQRYGISGREEARAYLEDPVLRTRLLEITDAVAERLSQGMSLPELLGSTIDARKLVSSLTLFEEIARELESDGAAPEFAELSRAARRVLEAAAGQGYVRCAFSTRMLAVRPG